MISPLGELHVPVLANQNKRRKKNCFQRDGRVQQLKGERVEAVFADESVNDPEAKPNGMKPDKGQRIAERGDGVDSPMQSGEYNEAACLILDVRLPGMSGLELQSHLVASNCQVPIIFISAHADEQTRSQALEAGAVDFLQKPFREQALVRAIAACGAIDPDQSN